MPVKEFLEQFPLYTTLDPTECEEWSKCADKTLGEMPKPAINMYCLICHSNQTFNMIGEYCQTRLERTSLATSQVIRIGYFCSGCKKFERVFLLWFHSREVKIKAGKAEIRRCIQKVGQYPPWSIKMDKDLEKLLGAHAYFYKNGLTCESQGYGIGAYAYFRRITEDVIGSLLDSIPDLIEPSEQERYKTALEATKKEKRADKKIALVKDLLPSSLRPDGMNPLNILHSALSKGLHGKTDEECMEQAERIRESLVFLVEQILRAKEGSKKFTANMKKLLEKGKKG